MEITYSYTKVRSSFGRQPLFCELGPVLCDSIPANEQEQKLFILRNPVHEPTQNAPCVSKHQVNTFRAEYSSTGANHAEGGWPRDVNVTDPEATQRYRRKIEKDDGYIHCVMETAPAIEHYVFQNNAIDMYETYYSEMSSQPPLERNSMRTVNVYRDPTAPGAGRPVSSVAWDPDGGHFAVTYVDVDYARTPCGSLDAFLWDLENANKPLLAVQPPCSLLDLQYNPRDRNTLAGALASGQVALWDRRKGGPPVNECPPHVAHRDLVRNVLFVASKSGQEFFSAGPDGACKWWDCRNMSDYTDMMIIDMVQSANDVPSMASSNGISVLEYEPTIPTKFMVGTENGFVISGNRKGKTALDKLPAKYDAHVGPVWTLRRNPGFLKNFLTVGDWTARVWSEDCRDSALLFTPPQRHKITDGDWSPTRISVMLLTQWDGLVSAWDLLRRQHEPVLSMQACAEPLLRVVMQDAGALAACGSRKGSVYMVELSHSLTQSDKNDKALMTIILDRESKREKILEARLREIRLKLRQAEEGSPTHSVGEPDASVGDRDLHEAATDYMNQSDSGLTAAVLSEVFSWLEGAALARAGAVCRAWRAAAAERALWRRLLLRAARAPPAPAPHETLATLYESQQWRSEYVLTHADWELRARLSAGRAPLQHAALSSCGTRLALSTEDAAVLIWEQSEDELWHEVWSRSVRARGWESVARAEWPRGERARLLLAGPLAGARRWELIVLQQQEEEAEWCVASRAGCSAGAAGCWAGAGAFLALQLRRLAPDHYATTVWLNAATQETQSEYAGVTTPLLRVYNEEKATITHVAVAEVPLDCNDEEQMLFPDDEWRAQSPSLEERPTARATLQTLVCGFSGESGALRAWGLGALQPPPLLASGDLRARAAARRAAAADADAAAADDEPLEPDEAAVRAKCTPHEYECRLPAALMGLVVQPDSRCAWACTAGASVTCVSLPTLRALRRLAPPASAPAPAHSATLHDLHYVHPAISDCYFVAPSGARSGLVQVWGVRSGAPRPAPLAHAAPALAAALPPRRAPSQRQTLLVLAADHIYVWRCRATSQPIGCASIDRDSRESS